MINIHDMDGSIIDPNPRLCEQTGYDADTLTGMKVWDLDQTIDVDEAQTLWEQMEVGDRTRLEGTYRRCDGSTFPVEIHIRRLRFEGADRVIAISRDITDLKEREETLREERNRLKRFASVVSHDLRNPLRVAEGRVELVREECDSEHVASIEEALNRMDHIIEDLLDLAREGRDIGATEPVAMRSVVESAWDVVATDAERADLRYQAESTALITIEADRDRVQQLVVNLLRNAIDHGGEDVTVTVGVLEDGFFVEDDGPGIGEEYRNKVFDVGYSTAEDETGFGLSIVKRIADAHGWEVLVKEGATGGARFEIRNISIPE